MSLQAQRLLSTSQAALLLGVSRIAVYKQIKQGNIRATRMGRKYVIRAEDLPVMVGTALTNREKHRIDVAVDRVVREYGETLRLLGKE